MKVKVRKTETDYQGLYCLLELLRFIFKKVMLKRSTCELTVIMMRTGATKAHIRPSLIDIQQLKCKHATLRYTGEFLKQTKKKSLISSS